MRRVPDSWLFEPWRMPTELQARCGVRVGIDIPVPLVELEAATREAKRGCMPGAASPEVRAAKAAIVDKARLAQSMPGRVSERGPAPTVRRKSTAPIRRNWNLDF